MAWIVNENEGKRVMLEAVHLVGRSDQCSLRLSDDYVSSEHASIRWDGKDWTIKDLGSLNHTYVDGSKLRASEIRTLLHGARLAFGNPSDPWRLEDASEPVVMAVPEDGSEPVVEQGGLLALPSPENPAAMLYRGGTGRWTLELNGVQQPLTDRSFVTVEGRVYRLCLPQAVERTRPVQGLQGTKVSSIALTFLISSDREEIELIVAHGSNKSRLPSRTHNELLLLLARSRRQDADAGLPAGNCGWNYHDELCKKLGCDPDRLNVDVYRIRKQFAELGLIDPGQVIERRLRTRQLRLGIPESTEQPL
jgi:FHA domain